MVKIVSLLSTLAAFSLGIDQISAAVAQSPPSLACLPPGETTAPECTHGKVRLGQRTLTVIGLGQVTVPADLALIEFRFGLREPIDSGSRSLAETRRATEAAVQPAIAALTQSGIPASNMTIPVGSPQSPRLLVRLAKPTAEQMQQVTFAVEQALQSSRQIFVQSIGAAYSVNSCPPLERSARRIALRDAQSQLLTLAQDVNVPLGELLAVTVMPLTGAPSSSYCGTKVGVPDSPLSFAAEETTPPYNPGDKPEVNIRSQVSVTHAIAPTPPKPINPPN